MKINQTSPKINPTTTGYRKNNLKSTNHHRPKPLKTLRNHQPKIRLTQNHIKKNDQNQPENQRVRSVASTAWQEAESERGMIVRDIKEKEREKER